MVHTCQWKHSFPEKRPDQLFQSVIQPCLFIPVKASKYSAIFQIFRQTGTSNGIYTCSSTSFGNLYFKYILSTEAEYISITNRPGINAHFKKLRRENIISESIESSLI